MRIFTCCVALGYVALIKSLESLSRGGRGAKDLKGQKGQKERRLHRRKGGAAIFGALAWLNNLLLFGLV
jgi:hypothetical protein